MGYKVTGIYVGPNKVRPPVLKYLCFTANTAGSTVKLNQNGSPTAVTLETSTDGVTWTTYTIGDTITLANIGDKVYMRNTSTTDTGFSISGVNYYYFVMTGSVAASGDINYLLNKNSTTTVGNNYYSYLFYNCTSLVSCPRLTATVLGEYCYQNMFQGCTNLETLPELPATGRLKNYCYNNMFYGCSKIKVSTTQTGEYQTPYIIPPTGTATLGTGSTTRMIYQTGGTFWGSGSQYVLNTNTTYYTSNTIV